MFDISTINISINQKLITVKLVRNHLKKRAPRGELEPDGLSEAPAHPTSLGFRSTRGAVDLPSGYVKIAIENDHL
jgi:hypothetical protein